MNQPGQSGRSARCVATVVSAALVVTLTACGSSGGGATKSTGGATTSSSYFSPLQVALLAPAIGALIGLLAGAYPAMRAATTEPITALRAA